MDRKNFKIFSIYLFVCIILLFPLTVFPLSGDLALFQTSIRLINHGSIPYHDFLDVKPPILFYIVQLITDIFGNGEYSVRWFDYFIQLLTVSILYFTICRAAKTKIPAFAAGIMYSAAYIAMNFTNTSQIESFFGLCIASVLWAQTAGRKNYKLFFAVSIFMGLFTGLKYTLGIILPVLLIDDFCFSGMPRGDLKKKYLWISAGFFPALLLTFLPFCNPQIASGYKLLAPYFSFYVSSFAFSGVIIKQILANLLTYFGDMQSVSVMLIFAAGVCFMLKNKAGSDELFPLLRISFLLVFGLYFSCLVERKFFIYHLSRANVPFFVICGTGILAAVNFFKDNYKDNKAFFLTAAALILQLFLPLSPLPRLAQRLIIPYYYYTNQSKYDNCYFTPGDPMVIRPEHKFVAGFVNSKIKSGDMVINASTGSGIINYFLKTSNLSKFTQSSYYVYKNADRNYIKEFVAELNKCKILIVQKNDVSFPQNGTFLSTFQALQDNPEIASVISRRLIPIKETPSFIIFERKE